jgi:glycine cleavage system aminomethyltransferase T
MLEGTTVGRVICGFQSPTLSRNLAYAYLDTPHFQAGLEVSVAADGVSQRATVVQMPFVDPEGKRLRA